MIQLVRPCRGRITQMCGNKQSHNGLPHTGNDYAYYTNGTVTDEVFAAAAGVVVYAGDSRLLGWPNDFYFNPDFDRNDSVDSSAGNVVVLRHTQGNVMFLTTYSHLEAFTVRTGDTVRAGQRIATIGQTGFSAGKHLHFELLVFPWNFGTAMYGRTDPNPYFIDGIAAQGTTEASEEDELNTDQNNALGAVFGAVNQAPGAGMLASQGDINIVLARMAVLEKALLGALGKPRVEPSAVLFKGDGDKEDTVYAWDEGTGYRALKYAEFAAVMAGGAELRTVEQAKITAGVK